LFDCNNYHPRYKLQLHCAQNTISTSETEDDKHVATFEVFFGKLLLLWTVIISESTWTDNKVGELATVCLPWQHWTKALVWFDEADISAFHSCVVVDLWQSLSEWHLLLSACVLGCRRENVGAWIRTANEH
jgi:hypothetical protein